MIFLARQYWRGNNNMSVLGTSTLPTQTVVLMKVKSNFSKRKLIPILSVAMPAPTYANGTKNTILLTPRLMSAIAFQYIVHYLLHRMNIHMRSQSNHPHFGLTPFMLPWISLKRPYLPDIQINNDFYILFWVYIFANHLCSIVRTLIMSSSGTVTQDKGRRRCQGCKINPRGKKGENK